MAEQSFRQRWDQYSVSKAALFWSCAACIAATMALGFTWGGWVTGGNAREMSQSAATKSRAQLAAAICVDRFMAAPDAAAKFAAFKKADYWKREDFLVDGGWVTFANMKEPVEDAADLCAERLMEATLPPA